MIRGCSLLAPPGDLKVPDRVEVASKAAAGRGSEAFHSAREAGLQPPQPARLAQALGLSAGLKDADAFFGSLRRRQAGEDKCRSRETCRSVPMGV